MESDFSLNPLSAAVMMLAVILITVLPRRMAMVPILAALCFLPAGQYLKIAGLHFFLYRLVLLASLARVAVRGELRLIHWCLLDTLVFLWVTAFVVLGSVSNSGSASFITQAGMTFGWLSGYIVARCLLRERDDFLLQIRFLAIMVIPLAAAMVVERATGTNVFSILGERSSFAALSGMEETGALLRDGEVRAQGSFSHPILAGTFGATLLPLMVGVIWLRNRGLKWSGVVGSICLGLIIWAAHSSGALLAAWGSMATLCIWRLRHSLRLVCIGLVLVVLGLQAGMNRPVWWIFDTISSFTGGTGWHRSYIIDAAIRHWEEWWLVGTPRTVHWGGFPPAPGNPENIDITNEYIAMAVNGGALTLILFLVILWTCFKKVGSAFHARQGSIKPETEWLAWCTGIALLAHCISFFSIAYYDRTIFFFFWLLTAIAAGAMERTWLIRDQSMGSVRRISNRQQLSLAGVGGQGVRFPGAVRGVHRKNPPGSLYTDHGSALHGRQSPFAPSRDP
jgi:hypothetical protein